MKLPVFLGLAACVCLVSCAKSPKARAAADEEALVAALQTYHRLYGKYPIPRPGKKKAAPPASGKKKKQPPKEPDNALDKAIMAGLTGKNGESIVAFPVKPKALDADGLLIDPWGMPYKFDVSEDRKEITVRSAGPDKAYATPDDVTKSAK